MHAFKKLSTSMQRNGNDVHGAAAVKPNDAATWPSYWGATDIEQFLSSKISNPENAPDYNSLAKLLATDGIASLNIVLCAFVKSGEVAVDLSDYSTQILEKSANSINSKELETHLNKTMGALTFCAWTRRPHKYATVVPDSPCTQHRKPTSPRLLLFGSASSLLSSVHPCSVSD
ncbi:Hypothetical protein, putative [Bodo saltans]|uniref:Uncharacterized protein n=1 Tax=Bodo saltans TaxID=75058 RepID=A0A0S4JJS9_BODSA|nr:Hypothetical protein, putative [Bodo saltans]|eukprot:CUG89434.1 Hypothetical protein, putative [Bodo saltans]